MIKLDHKILDENSKFYLDSMKDKIVCNYNNLEQKGGLIDNPFTNQPFFSHVKIEEQIEFLLTKNLDQIFLKYPNFKTYFSTCEFIFYSESFFKKGGSRAKKRELRKNYLDESIVKSKWVDSYYNKKGENIIKGILNSDAKFKLFVKEVRDRLKQFNDNFISEIINYDFISVNVRHELLFNLSIEVCPYCNRNYISKYKKNGLPKSTADLDHFYPKSIFALFSLSLYNFVPACQICNSRFKLAKGIKIVNPFSEDSNHRKYRFEYQIDKEQKADPNIFYNESLNFNLSIVCEDVEYQNNVDLFHLTDLYNSHKAYVSEILYKKEAYNDSYKELFNNLFNENMQLNESEINMFLYGISMDEKDFFKKPLSKLTYDIVKNN